MNDTSREAFDANIRARLTANANDFDAIVMDLLNAKAEDAKIIAELVELMESSIDSDTLDDAVMVLKQALAKAKGIA